MLPLVVNNAVATRTDFSVQGVVRVFRTRKSDRIKSCNYMCTATRTNFLVRGVVRRRRAFRGLKTSSGKIGRNGFVLSDYLERGFFACQPTSEPRTRKSDPRVIRRVVRHVRFPRPGSSDTSDGKIGACNHRLTKPVNTKTVLSGEQWCSMQNIRHYRVVQNSKRHC